MKPYLTKSKENFFSGNAGEIRYFRGNQENHNPGAAETAKFGISIIENLNCEWINKKKNNNFFRHLPLNSVFWRLSGKLTSRWNVIPQNSESATSKTFNEIEFTKKEMKFFFRNFQVNSSFLLLSEKSKSMRSRNRKIRNQHHRKP